MISALELKVMSAQTQAFIAADAEDIQVRPRITRVSDGAGGWVEPVEPPLLPVTVRLIPQSDKVPEAAVSEGRRSVPEFILIAMPGTNLDRYDVFSWRGKEWEISHIHEKPEYELKADVVLHVG